MPLMEIHSIFKNRKSCITRLLRREDADIDPEKRHELQGALNEIEIFLKTLEFYNEGYVAKPTNINLIANPVEEETPLLARIEDIFRRRK